MKRVSSVPGSERTRLISVRLCDLSCSSRTYHASLRINVIQYGKHRLELGRFTRIDRDNRNLPYLPTSYRALAASDGRHGSWCDRFSIFWGRQCALAYSAIRFRPDSL